MRNVIYNESKRKALSVRLSMLYKYVYQCVPKRRLSGDIVNDAVSLTPKTATSAFSFTIFSIYNYGNI